MRLALGTEIQGGNQYTDDRDEDGNPGADGIPDSIGVDAIGNKIYARQETILDGRFLTGNRAVIVTSEVAERSTSVPVSVLTSRTLPSPKAETAV